MNPYNRAIQILHELGPDEVAVLVFIAERLLVGQRTYGVLSLKTDQRDWERERDEEAADLLVYCACDALKKGRGYALVGPSRRDRIGVRGLWRRFVDWLLSPWSRSSARESSRDRQT